MACCGGGGSFGTTAYQIKYVDAEGQSGVTFALDIGGYRMVKSDIQSKGGVVSAAIQVPRKKYDEWLAQQEPAA